MSIKHRISKIIRNYHLFKSEPYVLYYFDFDFERQLFLMIMILLLKMYLCRQTTGQLHQGPVIIPLCQSCLPPAEPDFRQ